MIFNFKAWFTQITQFKEEPYLPSPILKLLSESNEATLLHKWSWHVEHVKSS